MTPNNECEIYHHLQSMRCFMRTNDFVKFHCSVLSSSIRHVILLSMSCLQQNIL